MIALLVVAALLAATVLTHYEGLRLLSRAVQTLRMDPRPRMVVVIFGVGSITWPERTAQAVHLLPARHGTPA